MQHPGSAKCLIAAIAMIASLPVAAQSGQQRPHERRQPGISSGGNPFDPGVSSDQLGQIDREIGACEKAPRFVDDCLDLIDHAAQTYWSSNDPFTAAIYYRRGSILRLKAFGAASIEHADGRYSLGYFLFATGHFPEAERELAGALQIYQASATLHPWTSVGNFMVGEAIERQMRYPDAEPYFEKAVRFGIQLEGVRSARTRGAIEALGRNLRRQHRYSEAEPLLRQALTLAKSVADAGDEAKILSELAAVLRPQNRLAEAETALREALAIWERGGSTDISPLVIRARGELAEFLVRGAGKPNLALVELRRITNAVIAREGVRELAGDLQSNSIYLRHHVESAWRVAGRSSGPASTGPDRP